MARLDRNKPNLRLIKGGKKDVNWQLIINVSFLFLILGLYTLVLTGR